MQNCDNALLRIRRAGCNQMLITLEPHGILLSNFLIYTDKHYLKSITRARATSTLKPIQYPCYKQSKTKTHFSLEKFNHMIHIDLLFIIMQEMTNLLSTHPSGTGYCVIYVH